MRHVFCLMVVLMLASALPGCQVSAPSYTPETRWPTTASYDKIMSLPAGESAIKPRPWPISEANYEPLALTHFASYYLDPFVTEGDQNDTYRWTASDAVAVVYCPARFIVNTIAIPVSMIKEPPGVLVTTRLDEPEETNPPVSPGE